MPCKRCLEMPAAHSFKYFGELKDARLYYTSPARAFDYKETPDTYTYYKSHIDEAKDTKWIWVIDCGGMQIKHCSSIEIIKKIMKSLLEEHNGLLEQIWILHPNAWIKGAITILKPFLKKQTIDKIKVLEGEKLELLVSLEKTGISGKPLNWLLATFSVPFVPTVLPNP